MPATYFKRISFLLTQLVVIGSVSCAARAAEPAASDGFNEKREFVGLTYVALSFLNLQRDGLIDPVPVLDEYRWNGLTDVVLIDGVCHAGRDGSLIYKERNEPFPEPVVFTNASGVAQSEAADWSRLCSTQTIRGVVRYFQQQGLRVWIAVTTPAWMEGGSLAVVCEDAALTEKYGVHLANHAKDLGCVGVDFDWEFPASREQADGYLRLIETVRCQGLRTGICALSLPTPGSAERYMNYDRLIEERLVDHIGVMHYHGYNPATGLMEISRKMQVSNQWKAKYPALFKRDTPIQMLNGIGFYSHRASRAPGEAFAELSMQRLYSEYGDRLLGRREVEGHAYWRPRDVEEIIQRSRQDGWSGCMSWLVSHDVKKTAPDEVSLQHAWAKAYAEIHAESN